MAVQVSRWRVLGYIMYYIYIYILYVLYVLYVCILYGGAGKPLASARC